MRSQSRVFEKAVGFRAKIIICANLWKKKLSGQKTLWIKRNSVEKKSVLKN